MSEQKTHSLSGGPHFDALVRSSMYRECRLAFTRGTGLPLALHPPAMLRLVGYSEGQDNPFCRLMAGNTGSCAACYALQQRLERAARFKAKTMECFAGLFESAVPVRVDGQLIGFLHTGHVRLQPPSRAQFSRLAGRLRKWGAADLLESVEAAYFQTRVLPRAQYESLIRLLTLFGRQLVAASHGLVCQPKRGEPGMITRARQIIQDRYAGKLGLDAVARSVNASPTYFTQRFKESTGLTFIDYLARVRVEKAKDLLRQRSLKIGAVALEAGFHSLSQFNRTFRKVTGQSPRQFRDE